MHYKCNTKTPEKGMSFHLIKNTKVLCKDNKLIIPASLQHRKVNLDIPLAGMNLYFKYEFVLHTPATAAWLTQTN